MTKHSCRRLNMENRLKEIRQKNSLTLEKMGEKVGIAKNTLSRYESGKREPKLEVWQKLADFFNVSVPYLQGLDEHTSNRLKELRDKKRVSQGDLAKATGLTRQAISNYENNERNPNEKIWQQLAKYFQVSVPYLKGEIDTEYLEKLVELLILLNFPKIVISYGDTDIDDDTKPFISVEIMSQICKSLGYDSKDKFLEIYNKVMKLVDDTTTVDYLQDFKNVVIQLLPKAKGTIKNLLNAYDNL